MKKLCFVLALLLCLSSFALAEDTIKIGWLGPLTGDVSQYGLAIKEGVDLYIEEINATGGVLGKQIELIPEDDKGDVTESTNAYNKLVYQDGVVAIIGSATSKPTIAVADLAKEDGIPMITSSATAVEVTAGKPNVFRSCFLDEFQAVSLANYSNDKLHLKRIAIIYDNGDDYSIGIAEGFKKQAEANGQEIVAFESGAATDVDFKAQLTNIKNANPDAIFVAFYYREASNIMKQTREVGLNDVTFLSADCMNGIESMITDDNELLSRLQYTDHFSADADTPEVKKFNESFEAKYGKKPYNAFNATAYDAAKILVEAIKNAGSTDPQAIVDSMKATDLICVTGHITFDENNNPIKSAFIMGIENGVEVLRDIVEPK